MKKKVLLITALCFLLILGCTGCDNGKRYEFTGNIIAVNPRYKGGKTFVIQNENKERITIEYINSTSPDIKNFNIAIVGDNVYTEYYTDGDGNCATKFQILNNE